MVIVKEIALPVHPLREGVAVMVPTILLPVLLGPALKVAMAPEPVAGSPIAVFEFVQAI